MFIGGECYSSGGDKHVTGENEHISGGNSQFTGERVTDIKTRTVKTSKENGTQVSLKITVYLLDNKGSVK